MNRIVITYLYRGHGHSLRALPYHYRRDCFPKPEYRYRNITQHNVVIRQGGNYYYYRCRSHATSRSNRIPLDYYAHNATTGVILSSWSKTKVGETMLTRENQNSSYPIARPLIHCPINSYHVRAAILSRLIILCKNIRLRFRFSIDFRFRVKMARLKTDVCIMMSIKSTYAFQKSNAAHGPFQRFQNPTKSETIETPIAVTV